MELDPTQASLFSGAYIFARVCLASVFVYSGIDKGLHWSGAIGEMKHFNLPFPTVTAAAVIALHLVAGLAVVFGIWTVPAALSLAVFTIFATLLGHPFWKEKGERFTRELTTFLEHIGLVGGLVLVAAIAHLAG